MASSIPSQQFEELFHLYKHPTERDILINILKTHVRDESNSQAIVSAINRLLSSSVTRPQGFGLLNKLLPFLQITLLTEKATFWVNNCITYSHKSEVTSARFECLGKLFELCSTTPDFNRQAAVLIPKVLDMCIALGTSRELTPAVLLCIQSCTENYAGTCGSYKNKLERVLLKFVDGFWSKEVLLEAGKTLNVLQQTGGSGVKGINFKNNWTNIVLKLCATIHSVCDELFEGINEVGGYERKVQPYEFSQFAVIMGTKRSHQVIRRRLSSLIELLSGLLISKYPTEKSISISVLIDVVKRGLLVDPFVDFNKSLEELHLAYEIHLYQIQLFGLLRSIIACFHSSATRHSFVITKLLVDSLQRIQNSSYVKYDSKFQVTALNLLDCWIKISGNKIVAVHHQKLYTIILQGIAAEKREVLLTLSTDIGQGKSPKAKKNNLPKKSENNHLETSGDIQEKEAICFSALKTLSTLLKNVALSWSAKTFKALYTLVIEEIFKIEAGNASPPYTNADCEAALYEVLESFFDIPSPVIPPPLHAAIALFTRQQTRYGKTAFVCKRALTSLEKICQPVGPSLGVQHLPTYQDEDTRDEGMFSYSTAGKSATKRPASESDQDESQDHRSKSIKILDVKTIKAADLNVANSKPIIIENIQIRKPLVTDEVACIDSSGDKNFHNQRVASRVEVQDDKNSHSPDVPDRLDRAGGTDDILGNRNEVEDNSVEVTNDNERQNKVSEKKSKDIEGKRQTCEKGGVVDSSDEESMLSSFVDVVNE